MLLRFNQIKTLSKLFSSLSVAPAKCKNKIAHLALPSAFRSLSTTPKRCDLAEFFDDKENWGKTEIKSGRSWRIEELRLKSNTDLHKLWFVLLKERNMLLTMEEEAKQQTQLFPSPERIDKVEYSMDALESVVRERNAAYHQLETGETGERPGFVKEGPFGLRHYYKMSQYPVPKHMNPKWKQKHESYKPNADTNEFLSKYYEKMYLKKKRQQRRNFNHVIGLMNRFPDMDMAVVREKYPDVDIEKAKASRKYRGHFVPS